jgi:lipopolysaccharide exporter
VVRRALAIAAAGQYLRIAVRMVSIAIVARLLTPTEIGVAVIGTAIMTIALGLREFASSEFLIQRHEVGRDDIRTSFTLVFVMTALMTAATFVLAPWIGGFYGEEQLATFLEVTAVAGLIEAMSLPILGLLRRDMAFGAVACIQTTNATVTAVASAWLAFAGFSYMSFAWAAVAAASASTVLSFCLRPDPSILRPAFRAWRSVLTFGGYNGASFVINRIYESLPQLFLGYLLPHAAVGLYNRASVASDIPDKIVLTSAFSVAFPALAVEVREGRSLKKPYLRALSLITVFYWPAQVLVALLAYPIVLLFLGQQWLSGVVPLLQLMAVAGMAWFPVMLTSPVLLAVGANRDRVLTDLVGRSLSAVVLCSAACFGVLLMAASKLVTIPFQMLLSLYFVRRHVPFRWGEVWGELWKSAVATAATAAGPVVVVALSDGGFALSLAATVMAVLLAVSGWLASVLVTRHPVLPELKRAVQEIAESSFVQRCRRWRGRTLAHGPRAEEA